MIRIDQSLCAGCAVCVTACPVEAITCPGTAVVDTGSCIECLECLDACPTDAISYVDPERERQRQAAIALFREPYATQKS